MSKFTPGPWTTSNTDALMFGVKQGNGMEPLGFVYGPSHAEQSDYGRCCIANARLIAAAPELLEALKLILSDLEQGADPFDMECRKRTASYDKARAALAKVEGT